MQPIPPAIKTLLKSKSMVGPDAPNGWLLLPEVVGAISWDSYSEWRRPVPVADAGIGNFGNPVWIGEFSVAKKTNGHLIVVGCLGTDDTDTTIPVLEGEVTDVTTLLSADDTVTGWAGTGITLCRCGRACVFNIGAALYLAVYQFGASGVAPAAFGRIYRSPSGNGGDWVLHGTVYSEQLTWTNWNDWNRHGTGGIPLVLDGGRWVLPGPRYYTSGGYTCVAPTIWTSDDAGVTWTERARLSTWGGGVTQQESHSRRIVEIADGSLWFAHDFNYAGLLAVQLYQSTDDGASWTMRWTYGSGNNWPSTSPTLHPHPDGLGFYVFANEWNGSLMTVRYCPDPDSTADMVLQATYTHGHAYFYRPLAVPFDADGRLVIACGNEVLGVAVGGAPLRMGTVRINREAAAVAQRGHVTRPNVNPTDPSDPGYYSPDRGTDDPAKLNEWAGAIFPGKTVEIELGYGTERALVFAGQIDDVVLDANGPKYDLRLECRDEAWRVIDRAVSDGGVYKITYLNRTIEYIVRDVLIRAGIPAPDITTQATGITVVKKEFERCQWVDILEWCLKVSGFDLVFSEDNKVDFFYPTDRQPEAVDEALVLNGTDWTDLANPWVVADSDRVRSAAGGGGVLYNRVTDYEIEYGNPARIRRRVGSTIPDGGTVYATYVFAAWSYEEGVDLFRLPYRISRREIYGKIIVTGQDANGNIKQGTYTYAGAAAYGVPDDKVHFVDIAELDTNTKCQAAADQLGNDMIRKSREAEFAVVGNPWIQVGDCVRLKESSSTATEIYRVVGLEHTLDDTGFITQFRAFHYGYTPLA